MAYYITVYNSTAKTIKQVPYPGFTDVVETVSGEAKTVFTLGVNITADHKIDVSVDGRGQPIENTHWSRDVETNTITTSEPVNVGSVFKARIYLL